MTLQVERPVVERAREGDREAFRMLVVAVEPEVFGTAYRMTGNAADAEDLTQEIFLRLFRNFRLYDVAQPFAPWFRRLITNMALNHRRDLRRRGACALREAWTTAEAPPEHAQVQSALGQLPDDQRMVVIQKYFNGLEVEEIADVMQVPSGTVKTWLYRAREALRPLLQKQNV
jgi:RNA polymerase sigma-70 factor (ECF subfamily)